jgi:hypothetical protein
MALANAANAGVAAHLPQGLDVVAEQKRFAAHARRSQSRFGSGMAATDHDHIEFLRVKHEKSALIEGLKMGAACAMEPPCRGVG